jgi:PGF-pre-PGF domain-containing protein
MSKYFLPVILLVLAILLMPTALAAGNVKINDFSSNVTNGTVILYTRFTGDITGNATNWKWIFKNVETNATTYSSANPTTHHNFKRPGVYDVTLAVWGPEGNDTLTKVAYVTANKNSSNLPVAEFSASPTSGNAPLQVLFTDSSKGATSWLWKFGDGTTSKEKNPVHNYSAAGNYTALLVVSNNNGWNTKTQEIIAQGEGQENILPVAEFDADTSSGSVQFTDLSQNANGWNWDFGDGVTSTDQYPVHAYSAAGNYTVTLTVSNEGATASKVNIINITEENIFSDGSDSSSGGSSHSSHRSGGSIGISPEPQSNVEAKEISQTFVGGENSVEFDFPNNATPVVNVSFDSKKTTGKTTAIAEMLKNKSTLVEELPSDEVYKSINIWIGTKGFATPENLENAVVNFKVEKAWIQDENIDQSSIALNMYNESKWDALSTSLSGEDDKYLYYTAETPGYSSFAITGKTAAIEALNETQSESDTQGPEQNNGSLAANVEQTSEQTESSNTSENGNTSTPGFEMIYGVAGVLGVSLCRRK